MITWDKIENTGKKLSEVKGEGIAREGVSDKTALCKNSFFVETFQSAPEQKPKNRKVGSDHLLLFGFGF